MKKRKRQPRRKKPDITAMFIRLCNKLGMTVRQTKLANAARFGMFGR